ncbi:hypothetical protein JX266_011119 [Neoarthrinium moseri]|nr:hypothetical protein JX266_011119 [Neoarthrinium moseri]
MTSDYSPSSLLEGNIRLLRLIPYRDKDAPIQCELFDYPSLERDEGSHLYEALSYAWGSSNKPQCIWIGSFKVPVTASLHSALRHMRDRYLERILWADAICIDQINAEELNKQVEIMAIIYAKSGSSNHLVGRCNGGAR